MYVITCMSLRLGHMYIAYMYLFLCVLYVCVCDKRGSRMVLLWCSSPWLLLSVAMERLFSSPIGEEINTIFNWLQGLPPTREKESSNKYTHTLTHLHILPHTDTVPVHIASLSGTERTCVYLYVCVWGNKRLHLYSGRMQLWDKRVSHSITPSSHPPSLPSMPLSLSLSLLCN